MDGSEKRARGRRALQSRWGGEEEFGAVEGSQGLLQDAVSVCSVFVSRHVLIGKRSTITVSIDIISSFFSHLASKCVCLGQLQGSASEDDASEVHKELIS